MTGRSRCPACGAAIPWTCNVPIVAWAVLRGRARCCAAPIPVFYPATETAAAVCWAAAAMLVAPFWPRAAALAAATVAVFAVVLRYQRRSL